jgi:hypothetical protein
MADLRDEKLTPSDPDDLAAALAFALQFEGRKRWHDADGFMADIVARRLVRHLERAGYVVMKRPTARRSLADWARLRGVVAGRDGGDDALGGFAGALANRPDPCPFQLILQRWGAI